MLASDFAKRCFGSSGEPSAFYAYTVPGSSMAARRERLPARAGEGLWERRRGSREEREQLRWMQGVSCPLALGGGGTGSSNRPVLQLALSGAAPESSLGAGRREEGKDAHNSCDAEPGASLPRQSSPP